MQEQLASQAEESQHRLTGAEQELHDRQQALQLSKASLQASHHPMPVHQPQGML